MELPLHAPASDRMHLLGQDPESLRAWLAERGQAPFRAAQLLEWVHRKGVTEFAAMSNLSKAFREELAQQAAILTTTIARESVAEDGTRKLLLSMADGATIETVWIPSEDRHTACLSSQVGCPVGCKFCASGIDGVERNLTAGEIVEQAVRVSQLIRSHALPPPAAPVAGTTFAPAEARLSNIVMMGMGEPLANYEQVVQALRILNAPWGLGIGARKITLSTVGLPAQIRKLAGEGLQINLARSLHAPEDELRRALIPWGRVPIADLLDACAFYFDQTGREVTLEYVLLEGVNDQPRHAEGLARIARRLRANINLLRYNPVAGLPYQRPSSKAAFEFQSRVRGLGANAHIRTSRGKDVAAACGQLRRTARSAEAP